MFCRFWRSKALQIEPSVRFPYIADRHSSRNFSEYFLQVSENAHPQPKLILNITGFEFLDCSGV